MEVRGGGGSPQGLSQGVRQGLRQYDELSGETGERVRRRSYTFVDEKVRQESRYGLLAPWEQLLPGALVPTESADGLLASIKADSGPSRFTTMNITSIRTRTSPWERGVPRKHPSALLAQAAHGFDRSQAMIAHVSFAYKVCCNLLCKCLR